MLGLVIHESIDLPKVALFIVIAMLYVTLARGRLLGSSVMIHEAQYPRVFSIVKRACAALEIPMPLIFVREDYLVPVAALGFGEPYSLVISSNYIEHFEDDELAFMIGRQLGHIAAGHTRFISLLSVNGHENPIVSLIFGPWLRICELTCDKVGLLVCGSVDAAVRAIAVASFHDFGRHIDVEQFAEQGREIAGDSVLRWGEWLGAEPYATRRISDMRSFSRTQQFATLEEWFLREAYEEPPALPPPGTLQVTRADCAGWWRRATAVFIDVIVVTALVTAFSGQSTSGGGIHIDDKVPAHSTTSRAPQHKTTTDTQDGGGGFYSNGWFRVDQNGLHVLPGTPLTAIAGILGVNFATWATAIYLALLVGLAGQSFGMMIAGLRVVTTDFHRPSITRCLWRYFLAFVLWPIILPLSIVQHRVMLHDRWSRTRLITAERAMARAAAPVATTSPA